MEHHVEPVEVSAVWKLVVCHLQTHSPPAAPRSMQEAGTNYGTRVPIGAIERRVLFLLAPTSGAPYAARCVCSS
jgi:hypothetical protein